jgi:diguanylate cyclase (GGDEF)-like protein/PAS domain S-box-containing protein
MLTTNQHQNDQSMHELLEWNQALLYNASDGIHILDENGHLVLASKKFYDMLGYDGAEMTGIHVSKWDRNQNPTQLNAILQKNLQLTDAFTFETQHRRKDGSLIDVEISALPLFLQGKHLLYCSSRDISERKILEKNLRQQIHFNTLLSNANEAIATATTEPELLQNLCDLIVQIIGAPLAWIGKPATDGYIQFVAASGNVAHLQQIRASIHVDSVDGQGMTGTTWRRARALYVSDIALGASNAARTEQAYQNGLLARASLPIMRRGKPWGIVAIYFAEHTHFAAELRKILEDLAMDIGFGLDRLDIIQSERDSNTYNLLLLNNMASGIIVIRYPERIVEQSNEYALAFYGIRDKNTLLLQHSRKLFMNEADFERMGEFSSQVLKNGHGMLHDMAYQRQDDGSTIYADLSGQRMPSHDNIQRIIWTIIDVTERHQHEQKLQHLSEEYQSLLDNAVTGIVLVRDGKIVSCNTRLARMTGLSMEQLVGTPTRQIYSDDVNYARVNAAYADLIRQQFVYIKNVSLLHAKDGFRLCDFHGRMLPDGVTSVWTIEDVSRREMDTRRLRRLSHFNTLLSEANQIIAKADNEAALLETICALPLQFTEAKLCWIGKPDDDSRVHFLASAGATDYLNRICISTSPDIPEGYSMSGESWRNQQAIFTTNLDNQPAMQPWQGITKAFGLNSCASLPIWRAGEIWALLTVYYEQEDIFDSGLQKILEDLAEDISFGLDRIDILTQQRKADAFNMALLNSATAGISVVRYPERTIIDANQAFMDIMGYTHTEQFQHQPAQQIYSNTSQNRHMVKLAENILRHERGSLRDMKVLRTDGRTIFIDISGQLLPQEDVDHPIIVWTSVDVTERHRLSVELSRQALFDALTDLPNRRALDLELERAMARVNRHNCILVTCMIDLDGFKPINDTHGHDAGDRVLKEVAHRLRENLRRTDFVARLGGDEFVLLLEDCHSIDEAIIALNKIGDAVQQPIRLSPESSVQIGLSAGISIYPFLDNNNPDMLIRYADQALYVSKELKNSRLHYWSLYSDNHIVQPTPVQSMLETGALEVFYQPILDNLSRQVVGVEALARIRNEHGQLLTPAEFLPWLNTDDLFELSRNVLLQSIQDITSLDDRGLQLWISVNIDPTSISARCVNCLKTLIEEHTISAERIVLEILESSNFLEQKNALDHLLELKTLGVCLALDDVGSAYSSLLRLKTLPIDKVKLDQSFVRTLEQDPTGILFTATVLDLARDLGVGMVVEGVETDDILDAVSVLGIPLLQGYQIARPMPLAELTAFLDNLPVRRPQHPTSLLGVYAKQIVHDRSLRNILRQHNKIVNSIQLGNTNACPIHDDLIRMDFAVDHLLHRQHHLYHVAIATFHEALTDNPVNENWQPIQTAQDEFLTTLLHYYQKGKASHALVPT